MNYMVKRKISNYDLHHPTIRIHETVKKQLDNLGKKGDTYTDIIKRLLEKKVKD